MNLTEKEISMIKELTEDITKSKLIEEKYAILERYLKLYYKKNNLMTKEDIELILMALSDVPLFAVEDAIGEMKGSSE